MLFLLLIRLRLSVSQLSFFLLIFQVHTFIKFTLVLILKHVLDSLIRSIFSFSEIELIIVMSMRESELLKLFLFYSLNLLFFIFSHFLLKCNFFSQTFNVIFSLLNTFTYTVSLLLLFFFLIIYIYVAFSCIFFFIIIIIFSFT